MSKTNFAFELQYVAPAAGDSNAEADLALESALKALLAAHDPAVSVSLGKSHKGNANRILELVSSASDEQIQKALQTICEQHGVTVSALE